MMNVRTYSNMLDVGGLGKSLYSVTVRDVMNSELIFLEKDAAFLVIERESVDFNAVMYTVLYKCRLCAIVSWTTLELEQFVVEF